MEVKNNKKQIKQMTRQAQPPKSPKNKVKHDKKNKNPHYNQTTKNNLRINKNKKK